MKKLGFLLTLFAISFSANATDLPFTGTKSFHFGGVPAYNENYELNIQNNGITTLSFTACNSQSCHKTKILYKGKYKPVIAIHAKEGLYHIKLTKKQAYLLDKNQHQEYGCDMANGGSKSEPCVSKYYQ